MGWQGTDMLTKGEHDRLWRNLFMTQPKYLAHIADSLRRANALAVVKELHELGIESDLEYASDLCAIAKAEGFPAYTKEELEKKFKEKES